jgi:hypothetical protein
MLQIAQQPLGGLQNLRPSKKHELDTNTGLGTVQHLQNIQNLVMEEFRQPGIDAMSNLLDFAQAQQRVTVFQIKPHRGTTIPIGNVKESSEMRWLREHSAQLSGMRGQWLLIANGNLLAHSGDFRDIRLAIKENNVASPFVHYVPGSGESTFILL